MMPWVVPAAAVQQGPEGTYVFVVLDGKVRMQTVEISPGGRRAGP